MLAENPKAADEAIVVTPPTSSEEPKAAPAPAVPAATAEPEPEPTAKLVEVVDVPEDVLKAALSAASNDKTFTIRKLVLLADQLTESEKYKSDLSKVLRHRDNPLVVHFLDNHGISHGEVVVHLLNLLIKQGRVLTPDNVALELKDLAKEILALQ